MQIDRKKLMEIFSSKFNLTCPICGGGKWEMSDMLWTVAALDEGKGVPLLYLGCLGCGYAVFFNAIIAGAIDKPQGIQGNQ